VKILLESAKESHRGGVEPYFASQRKTKTKNLGKELTGRVKQNRQGKVRTLQAGNQMGHVWQQLVRGNSLGKASVFPVGVTRRRSQALKG